MCPYLLSPSLRPDRIGSSAPGPDSDRSASTPTPLPPPHLFPFPHLPLPSPRLEPLPPPRLFPARGLPLPPPCLEPLSPPRLERSGAPAAAAPGGVRGSCGGRRPPPAAARVASRLVSTSSLRATARRTTPRRGDGVGIGVRWQWDAEDPAQLAGAGLREQWRGVYNSTCVKDSKMSWPDRAVCICNVLPLPASTATIHDLGDDLLLAIFLRLPSLPSLVRAAFACRSFLAAVRSSPAFRRRFRDLHPPPLLGLFFDPCGPYVPSFTPLRRQSDPDLAAAVRGADFFLTRVPATDDASPGWGVLDCRGGYLFLLNSEDEETATYNPVTRVLDLIPLPPDEIMDEVLACHGVHLISSDEAPGSFRVVYVFSNESRVRATVFSSCTREWRVLPWEEPAPEQQGWLPQGTQVNGSLYWAHKEQAYMMVLDTATLQFSSIDLPEQMKGQGHLYRVGETKDGKLCIVRVIEFDMFVWHRGPDADGADKWKLGKIFRLEEDVLKATGGSHLEHSVLKVLEIMDGIVYLFLQTSEDAHLLCWFLTLCLKTGKLDKLFRKQNDSHVHPYIMAWPPSLVSEIMNP